MVCRYCGNNIPEGCNVCPYCFQPVENSESQKQGLSNSAKAVIIAAAAVVLVAVIVIIAVTSGSGGSSTSVTSSGATTEPFASFSGGETTTAQEESSSAETTTQPEEETTVGSVDYEIQRIDDTEAMDDLRKRENLSLDEVECYFDLVVLEGDSQEIQKINDDIYEFYKETYRSDIDNYLAYDPESGQGNDPFLSYQTSVAFFITRYEPEITYNANGILSIYYIFFVDSAETFQANYSLVYDLSTGERIGLSDLTTMSDDELFAALTPTLEEYINKIFYIDMPPDTSFTARDSEFSKNNLDEYISQLTLDDIVFYIKDEEIYITFYSRLHGVSSDSDYRATGVYIDVVQ